MRTLLTRTLLAAGTIAVSMSLAVPAAVAAGTWTVTGGTRFTATESSGTTFTLTDNTAHLFFTCTVGAAGGTVINETSGTTTTIGTITSSSLGNPSVKCEGPLGSTSTASQKTGTTATLNVASYNSTTKVVTGTITNLDETMSISSILGTCTPEVKGTAGYTYNDNSSLLQFTTAGSSLTVSSTSGFCAGIIKANDQLALSSGSGGLTVVGSPTNPIVIRQP